MKLKFLIAAAILAASTTALAIPKQPSKCPSVESMRGIGLEKMIEQQGDVWFINTTQKFDTDTNWHLEVYLRAANYDEAYWKAHVFLNQITKFREGPYWINESRGFYACWYEDYRHAAIFAVTDGQPSRTTIFSHALKAQGMTYAN